MALKDIVLKLIIDGKESLVTLDKLDNKTLGIGKTVKNLAGAMGLAFGSAQVINFMKDSVALVQRENEVIGKLNATLKSTNYTAGMMSDELIELANNLEELTNYKFDDKDIINAEGILLTFKKINKEAFPEAMRLALDLSVRFEQDLTTSVKQLGKALDDPEKGLTALRKAGILFTDQQVELIKSLIKENDLLGAQKMILDELSTQVSGSAAASVDEYTKKINRLNEALEDVQKVLGDIVTGAGIGLLDYLEGLFKTGSMAGAMMYLKTKQQQSGYKPSTQADFLNEARSRAGGEIQGKSDAYIKKLISSNRSMYNASYMGVDSLGNVIDPEGNLAMLDAKLAVYQTALIKTDDKITDHKKENAEEFYKHLQKLEEDYLKWERGNNDLRYWTAKMDNNAGVAAKNQRLKYFSNNMNGAVDVPEKTGAEYIAEDLNQIAASAQFFGNEVAQIFDNTWDTIINGSFSAADIMNNLFRSLLDSIGDYISNALFKEASGSFVDGLFSFLPLLGDGGIVTKPTLAGIGESGPEAVIPLNRFSAFGGGSEIRVIVEGELKNDSIYLANKRAAQIRKNIKS